MNDPEIEAERMPDGGGRAWECGEETRKGVQAGRVLLALTPSCLLDVYSPRPVLPPQSLLSYAPLRPQRSSPRPSANSSAFLLRSTPITPTMAHEEKNTASGEEHVQMLEVREEKDQGDLLPSPVSATAARAPASKAKLSATMIIPVWIILSSAVIIYNNHLYNTLQFRYPVFLVTWHLTFAVSSAPSLLDVYDGRGAAPRVCPTLSLSGV